jgi:restriction system protein
MRVPNIVFVIVVILVIVGAIQECREQYRKSLSLDKIIQEVDRMSSREFEFFCAKLFELQGYRAKVTKATGDGGKDVILWKGNNKYYVECKHFNRNGKVSRPIANKLYGTMCADGVHKGFIVTTGSCTKECREWCRKTGIKIISHDELVGEIQKLGLDEVASAIRHL